MKRAVILLCLCTTGCAGLVNWTKPSLSGRPQVCQVEPNDEAGKVCSTGERRIRLLPPRWSGFANDAVPIAENIDLLADARHSSLVDRR